MTYLYPVTVIFYSFNILYIYKGSSLIAGIKSDDQFLTTYRSLTSGPTNSKQNSVVSINDNFNWNNNNLQDDRINSMDEEFEVYKSNNNANNSHSKHKSLTKYSGNNVLGRSLLSNIGASIASNIN